MILSITNNKTGKQTICCLLQACDIIGLEEASIYNRLKKSKCFQYRHFLVNKDVEVIKNKPRGIPIQQLIAR